MIDLLLEGIDIQSEKQMAAWAIIKCSTFVIRFSAIDPLVGA